MSRSVERGRLALPVLAAIVSACGAGAAPAPNPATGPTSRQTAAPPTARAALAQIHSRSCACTNATCADSELWKLAAFVDSHRADKVSHTAARELANTGVAIGNCLVKGGVAKYRVADSLGRGRPFQLLTHIVGGMCSCRQGDRTCAATQLGRYDRFLSGSAERVVATKHPDKHPVLIRRFNQCTLRAGVHETALIAILKTRNRKTQPPPSESLVSASETIAAAACGCAGRPCAAAQLLALVAYVQTNVRMKPVTSTLRRISAAVKRSFSCLRAAGLSTDEISAALTKATR